LLRIIRYGVEETLEVKAKLLRKIYPGAVVLSVVTFKFGKSAGKVESFTARIPDVDEVRREGGIDPSKFILSKGPLRTFGVIVKLNFIGVIPSPSIARNPSTRLTVTSSPSVNGTLGTKSIVLASSERTNLPACSPLEAAVTDIIPPDARPDGSISCLVLMAIVTCGMFNDEPGTGEI
jgi:hypothetical protein